MNKTKLQAELLAKIKPGVKPSDLKKPKLNTPASSPPISPIIEPLDKKAKQNSEQEKALTPSQLKQLQEQVNFHAQQAQTYLTNLQAAMAQLDQAELIIKDWEQKYSELEKASKNPTKIKQELVENIKTFLCSDCQQPKPQPELSRQFNNFSFCLTCSKKARQQAQQEKLRPEPSDFICYTCQQTKNEIPTQMKLDQTLTEYLICSLCRPTLKEFNEADLITDELWAKYPYSSASEILEKEFNIKKEETW